MRSPNSMLNLLGCWLLVSWIVSGCDETPKDAGKGRSQALTAVSAPSASVAPVPSPPRQPDPDSDPAEGKFTLAQATEGLTGMGKLTAELDTTAGKITCSLYEDKAPTTVANFVGLARGLRPWKDSTSGKWVKSPVYDGSAFHRVIGRFMIQGGCPKGDCSVGNPGYMFEDEIWQGATHDRAGLLCMANSGPNTNGLQFFITDAKCTHLDARGHTIFGDCKPLVTIRKIANSRTDNKDRPSTPQLINKVTIRRAAK